MLLVDPAATSRCQHHLVAWHFLTDEADSQLSHSCAPGLELTGELSHSMVAETPPLGGEPPRCTDVISGEDGEQRRKGGNSAASPRNTTSSSSWSVASQPRLHLQRARSHGRACETILSRSIKEARTVLLEWWLCCLQAALGILHFIIFFMLKRQRRQRLLV